jgi:hypothetical protein
LNVCISKCVNEVLNILTTCDVFTKVKVLINKMEIWLTIKEIL